jgi:hypothetical protein
MQLPQSVYGVNTPLRPERPPIFGKTITSGILSLPILADSFRCLIQPFTIRQPRDQFDGAEKLHRVRVTPAARLATTGDDMSYRFQSPDCGMTGYERLRSLECRGSRRSAAVAFYSPRFTEVDGEIHVRF